MKHQTKSEKFWNVAEVFIVCGIGCFIVYAATVFCADNAWWLL